MGAHPGSPALNVLLDLDGTLTDPGVGIIGCIRHALAGVGHACPEEKTLRSYIGPPLAESFGALFGGDEKKVARAIELYRERFGSVGLFENGVYPGIDEALAELGRRGARMYIATSKPRVFAERIVAHFGLAKHVRAVYGSELDGTRSNKAHLIAHILKSEGLKEARMVGDRLHDIAGAKANAVPAIGVLWGYGSKEELLQAGAVALCETPPELPDTLR